MIQAKEEFKAFNQFKLGDTVLFKGQVVNKARGQIMSKTSYAIRKPYKISKRFVNQKGFYCLVYERGSRRKKITGAIIMNNDIMHKTNDTKSINIDNIVMANNLDKLSLTRMVLTEKIIPIDASKWFLG